MHVMGREERRKLRQANLQGDLVAVHLDVLDGKVDANSELVIWREVALAEALDERRFPDGVIANDKDLRGQHKAGHTRTSPLTRSTEARSMPCRGAGPSWAPRP